jgi:hypothetical protein
LIERDQLQSKRILRFLRAQFLYVPLFLVLLLLVIFLLFLVLHIAAGAFCCQRQSVIRIRSLEPNHK